MDSLSARLRHARAYAGLSQETLARQCDVISITISRYERGVLSPSRDATERLATALGVTPAWLAYGHGRGPRKRRHTR